jgi:hypothetical protein
MTNTLLLVLIGAFVGWNLPQPIWARWIQSKVVGILSKIASKWSKKK